MRRSCDDGLSLVETMVAVAIMGIAVVSILGGLGTATRSTSFNRAQSDSEAALRSAGESVKRQAYRACPDTTAYAVSDALPPTGVTVTVAKTERWNGTAFQDSCPNEDAGFQRITLRATSDAGRLVRDFQVVKRR